MFWEIFLSEGFGQSGVEVLKLFNGALSFESVVSDLGENEVAAAILVPISLVPDFAINEYVSARELIEEVDLCSDAFCRAFEHFADDQQILIVELIGDVAFFYEVLVGLVFDVEAAANSGVEFEGLEEDLDEAWDVFSDHHEQGVSVFCPVDPVNGQDYVGCIQSILQIMRQTLKIRLIGRK